ncbi:MAG: hypothetical protein IJ493_02235 [Clostridia bacterium]|nr:hypothetical protein [Clostridia bacterium]
MLNLYTEGHRGFCAEYPENTLLSYEAAIDLGVDAFEFDIWLSKDKVPVLMHDGDTMRTCGVPGHLRDRTLTEIKTLCPSNPAKFGDKFAGKVQVPTLRELLELVKSKRPDMKLGVEIKEYTEETVDIAVAMLKEYGKFEDCWFYAFNGRIIRYLKEKYNARTMGYPDLQMGEFDGYDCYDEIGLSMTYVRSELCAFYRAKGLPMHMYCADTEADVRLCIERGASLITANDPRPLLRVKEEIGRCVLEAHQGVASDAPGNTMAAFQLAVEQGYGMIELDTKFTADNRCVVLHDRTVNRTCRAADGAPLPDETKIAELTFEEARALDAGVAFGEQYRGEKIPAIEEVLALAKESGIRVKFDNVTQSHTSEQRAILYNLIEASGALPLCGFTASQIWLIEEVLKRFPAAQIHYDGPLDDESLVKVAVLVPKEQLTVWQRADNGYASNWCKVPPVTDESAAKIHEIGRLGLWLLTKPEELAVAVARYRADVIETSGLLKP